MYDKENVNLLDDEVDLQSPLDNIEPITSESEIVKPDPDAMLELLQASDSKQRMLAAGAYRDWETDRKSTRLNSSH